MRSLWAGGIDADDWRNIIIYAKRSNIKRNFLSGGSKFSVTYIVVELPGGRVAWQQNVDKQRNPSTIIDFIIGVIRPCQESANVREPRVRGRRARETCELYV